MPNSVTLAKWSNASSELYAADGQRKYINVEERTRFLACAKSLPKSDALFCRILAWTGARVSEVLALTPASFQIEAGVVTFITLKRRKFITREVPIPPELMRDLVRHFNLRRACAKESGSFDRVWPWSRVTAWRLVKAIMSIAGIFGVRACPRGLRHAVGVATLGSGVPLHLIQRWLGHARLSTTAIYMNVCGPEEQAFAKLFWASSLTERRPHAALPS